MRVIVWGINYAPEVIGIGPFNTGLCDYLHEQGHDVEMVTAFTYYPAWAKAPQDRGVLYRTENHGGVRVHRCWHHVPRKVSTVRRIWHELSFGLTSVVRVLLLRRADVLVVISPPLILGFFASMVGFAQRRPFVFHVQDLQPDAAIGLGMVKRGRGTRFLYLLEGWSYRRAAAVCGISEGMLKAFAAKGVPAEKRVLFPNWNRAKLNGTAVDRKAEAFRTRFGLPQEGVLATYSGNLGRKQGIEILVDAAALLARDRRQTQGDAKPEIFVLIVGDGAQRERLEARVAAIQLPNLKLLPLLGEEDYRAMLAATDICLITQEPGTGQFFFPSKLLSVLSAGVPVLSVADEESELAKAVKDGGFGINVADAQPDRVAAALNALAQSPEQLAGYRTRTAWVEKFARERVLGAFAIELRRVAGYGGER